MRSALACALLLPIVLEAQAAPPPCTYDACALRVERQRLWRGAPPGQPGGRLTFWGAPRLAPLVAGSDSALAYAREFDRHYTTGIRISTLAGAVGGVLIAVALHNRSDRVTPGHWWLIGGSYAALSVGIYGGWRANRALRALSRALWWYNRDLPR